jgi:hypothetical protein
MRARPNAVQLGAADGGGRWSGWLWPVDVAGSFDVPFRHLAFDESWTGPDSAGGVEPLAQQCDRVRPGSFRVQRGKNRAPVTASGG